MDWEQYRHWGQVGVDWGATYRKNLREFPVRPNIKPGEIFNKIPDEPPEDPEQMQEIFKDFQDIIIPGITHWQHPTFFSYFPSNASCFCIF